jgi:hypothetical protein
MGWSIGYDENLKRDIGYGVPAHCDYPGCRRVIDRGLAYVCGGDPFGGEHGCGMHFCYKHLLMTAKAQLCERCAKGKRMFPKKPEHKTWMRWKLKDESWAEWRAENPEEVDAYKKALLR